MTLGVLMAVSRYMVKNLVLCKVSVGKWHSFLMAVVVIYRYSASPFTALLFYRGARLLGC